MTEKELEILFTKVTSFATVDKIIDELKPLVKNPNLPIKSKFHLFTALQHMLIVSKEHSQ